MSVYVISDGNGHIKIGMADSVKNRIKTLQCGNPYPLKLLYQFWTSGCRYGDVDLEHALHKRYREFNIKTSNQSSEWFDSICLEDIDKLDTNIITEMMREILPNHRLLGDVLIRKYTEAETEWIAVTERLPSKTDNYLVTRESGNVGVNRFCLEFGKFACNVTAWMPLPEPSEVKP